jgi:antitoxin ParD1/3/4
VYITLKPDRNQFIEAQVKSGKYSSVDEINVAALELLTHRNEHPESALSRIG